MSKKRKCDFYTFVAGSALERGTFNVRCNCGGKSPISLPLSSEFVVCPECMSIIRIFVRAGDPGYVIGQAPDGEPMLFPVQGSAAKPISTLTDSEKKEIIESIKKQIKKPSEK